MADEGDIIEVMKKAAMGAVAASQPAKFVYGKVTRAKPLEVAVNEKLTLPAHHLRLTQHLTEYRVLAKMGTGGYQYMTIDNKLRVGDKVVLLKNQGGNGFLIIDRVVKAT